MISWHISKEDQQIILKIVAKLKKNKPSLDAMTAIMDLQACHANGCKLDLQRMNTVDVNLLWHDIYGINQNLCRETGQFLNHFLPRFCLKEGE